MNIGRAIHLSDSQVEDLSQVSELDIEAARSLWTRSVPARWKPLLDSQMAGEAEISSPFVWDASSRRYIDRRSRRYIPYTELRSQALEPLIRAQKVALRSLGSSLQEGGRLSDWQRAMIETVKVSQIAAGLAANGGHEATNEKDKKKIAAEIVILLLLLRGFAYEVEAGKFPINGRLLLRSDLYAAAARDTFEETRRFGMGVYFGAVEERRVLGRAEHCHSDGELEGCVELADLGWRPINSLPRLGRTPCRTNCQCHFDYRFKDESGAWVKVDDSATVALILKTLKVKESVDE